MSGGLNTSIKYLKNIYPDRTIRKYLQKIGADIKYIKGSDQEKIILAAANANVLKVKPYMTKVWSKAQIDEDDALWEAPMSDIHEAAIKSGDLEMIRTVVTHPIYSGARQYLIIQWHASYCLQHEYFDVLNWMLRYTQNSTFPVGGGGLVYEFWEANTVDGFKWILNHPNPAHTDSDKLLCIPIAIHWKNMELLQYYVETMKYPVVPDILQIYFRMSNVYPDIAVMEYLFKQGADIYSLDNNGRNMIHVAPLYAAYWIDKGLDLELRDCNGSTALMYICSSDVYVNENSIINNVTTLVNLGANIVATGSAAYNLAATRNKLRKETLEVLHKLLLDE
jgi:hypothetical protein